MTNLMTDLMQHLQNLHADQPGGDGRLMVAVPTTPHTIEQFEVSAVHHEGPSVLLYCEAPEVEHAVPQAEQPQPLEEKSSRTCVHNDYEDLC